jgi:heme exporter protein A
MIYENKIEALNLYYIRQKRSLFSELSFSLTSGNLLLVKGANGSGKSSLLRLLTGLVTPSSGEINWQDKSIYEWRKCYWQHVHYVGHSNGIKLELTATENLKLARYYSSNTDPLQIKSETFLADFQLIEYKNTPMKFLSAGQRRRLALAKLLWVPKSIWILDEPLTALDKSIERLFLEYLKIHLEKGGIAIISSHHSMRIKDVSIQILRLGM